MIQRPVIKAKYCVETTAEGVYLLAENEYHVLEGAVMFALVPLLDGIRTWDEIRAALEPHFGAEVARAGVEVLIQNRHVQEAVAWPPPAHQVFWTELGLEPAEIARRIADTNIHVVALGADPTVVFQGLASLGFASNPAAPAGLQIAVVDDYLDPQLEALNRQSLALGRPWLLIKPQGLWPLVGPFMTPGRTACWACLAQRLRHNRGVESFVQARLGRAQPSAVTRAAVPLGETQAVSLALLQMARWLARGENPNFEHQVVAIDVLSGEQKGHPIVRRPQCPACGEPALGRVAGRPIAFQGGARRVENENGARAETPDETFARYAHHVSSLTGVVGGVYSSPVNAATPLRSFVAGHNFALNAWGLGALKAGLRTHSAGKGRTDPQARTSALCEALERYSGLWRGEEERIESSLARLGGEAVDPRRVMLFSQAQYQERANWAARGNPFQLVPEPFDPERPTSWSPVWSWTQKRRKWAPTSLLYYNFQSADEPICCLADSNGSAAGGLPEDAALQGALELVERDSVALWWANRLSRPGIDLGSLDDPFYEELARFYETCGREYWVLDLTADLGVPAAAAVSRRTRGPTEDIMMGFGAHLEPRIAISRAVTELNQFMPAVMDVGDDGATRYVYDDPAALRWWKTATLASDPYLAPAEGKLRSLSDLPPAPQTEIKGQLTDLFGRIEAKGIEVLLLDQTRPDIGLPVMKVIAPGLRHFWARYAPGRLYDAPVALGWLAAPTAEADLNPTAMFL